jgi:hypothetical protein
MSVEVSWRRKPKLCYNLKGLGSITDEANEFLSLFLNLLAALGPGVHSAFNRNEHQQCFWGVEGSSTSHSPVGHHHF